MAHVATSHNAESLLTTSTPFMDRLTHAVIKETSKSLKHYIDVKRRENGFILNPNSSAVDSVPMKARFMYGTTKEYPPLYGSCHSDSDVKNYLRSIQQQSCSMPHNLEKQICREELNYHMRTQKLSSTGNQEFAKLTLQPPRRSNSSCSGLNHRAFRHQLSKSTSDHCDPLIDDAANILAGMVKARQSIFNTSVLSRQTPSTYVSRNANPSPRQTDDQPNMQSTALHLPPTDPAIDRRRLSNIEQPKKQKRTTENVRAKAASIMQKAKPVTKNFQCEYKVSVTTGNCNGASTNAPIRIKLYGTKGCTTFIELVQSETHQVLFHKNQTDVFNIPTFHVGQLVGITIGHDRQDMRASWFLSKVTIDDPIRERTYDIPCNAWLSSKSSDQKTMRDFQVASMVSHRKHSDSNEHREDIGSQSDYSTTTTERTISSTSTNRSQHKQFTGAKRPKRHRQRRLQSIESKASEEKPTHTVTAASTAYQPLVTTTESQVNPVRPVHSPPIARSVSSSSSDTIVQDNIINRSRSATPPLVQPRKQSAIDRTPLPRTTTDDTLKVHSIDHDRPPSRLKDRNASASLSPERSAKINDDNDAYSFFE